MGNIALAIFLLLFGVTMLISTELPRWVVGLAAVITGLIIGFGAFRKSPYRCLKMKQCCQSMKITNAKSLMGGKCFKAKYHYPDAVPAKPKNRKHRQGELLGDGKDQSRVKNAGQSKGASGASKTPKGTGY